MGKKSNLHKGKPLHPQTQDGGPVDRHDTEPDWTQECEACGSKPVLPITGMCGPCTWGEADTAGGNW